MGVRSHLPLDVAPALRDYREDDVEAMPWCALPPPSYSTLVSRGDIPPDKYFGLSNLSPCTHSSSNTDAMSMHISVSHSTGIC